MLGFNSSSRNSRTQTGRRRQLSGSLPGASGPVGQQAARVCGRGSGRAGPAVAHLTAHVRFPPCAKLLATVASLRAKTGCLPFEPRLLKAARVTRGTAQGRSLGISLPSPGSLVATLPLIARLAAKTHCSVRLIRRTHHISMMQNDTCRADILISFSLYIYISFYIYIFFFFFFMHS